MTSNLAAFRQTNLANESSEYLAQRDRLRLAEESQCHCVLIGAGLCAPAQLRLFEKLLNVIHTHAASVKMCFNTTPANSAEAVQRWV